MTQHGAGSAGGQLGERSQVHFLTSESVQRLDDLAPSATVISSVLSSSFGHGQTTAIRPAGIPQHIVQRGNNRLPCFLNQEDHLRGLHLLNEAVLGTGHRPGPHETIQIIVSEPAPVFGNLAASKAGDRNRGQ